MLDLREGETYDVKNQYNILSRKLDEFQFEDDWSILIKSFKRFPSVYRVIKSIRKFYPWVPIIICDDSGGNNPDFIQELIGTDKYLTWYKFEENIGLAAGRNAGMQRVQTKYVLICDDDFEFTKETKIERFTQILAVRGGIVSGGIRQQGGPLEGWGGDYDGYDKIVEPTRDWRFINGLMFQQRDLTLNFSFAEVNTWLENPWDEQFKIGCEHQDHCITLHKAGVPTFHTDDVIVNHVYAKPPNERARSYKAAFYRKHDHQPVTLDGHIVSRKPFDHRPNIIVLGRSPKVATWLKDHGWNLGFINSLHENYKFRDVNDLVMENRECNIARMLTAIQSLKAPWAVMDHRFGVTLQLWTKLFTKLNELPVVVLPLDVQDSALVDQYGAYPGQKIMI